MESTYFNPLEPGSFGGIQNANRYLHGTRKDIKDFLISQNAYTVHKPVRYNFPRRRVLSLGIDDLWQIDLVDLQSYARLNDNNRFLLTCIDVFSKFAWIVPLKNKTGSVVTDAFKTLLIDRKCNYLQSDKGTEFLNVTFQQMCKENQIHHYTSENDDIKCAVVERFNRTIKSKMFKYFTFARTNRYIDVLQDLVYSYNNTVHRSIGMTPTSVTTTNQHEVRQRLYPIKPPLKWKYDVGSKVRISKSRRVFRKGYLGGWSEEIFVIVDRIPTNPVTYELKDLLGESIKGKFYEPELQLIVKEDDVYDVEKVLKTRRRNGQVEYLVKWRGYPEKFNSWTDAAPK